MKTTTTLLKMSFLFCFFLISSIEICGQTLSPEGVERAKKFNEIYPIVMEKLDAGTLTLEDADYISCKRLLRKMGSYDKYTTMKQPEMISKEKAFKNIRTTLKIGTAYLSTSKTKPTEETKFTVGESIYLIINTGESFLEESLENTRDGGKALKIYFKEPITKNWGELFIPVPQSKLKEHEYIAEIKFDLSNPEYKHVNTFLGKLSQGTNEIMFSLVRSQFSKTVSMNMPRINIPITLTIKDNKFSDYVSNSDKSNYQNMTLEKAVVSNSKLEEGMKSLYVKSYPNHKVLRVVIVEDWYDLKDKGRLNYKKANAYLAVKKEDGNCYRVYIGYVKENISKTEKIELGTMKILNTGAKLSYKKMPCENVNK